VRTEFHGKIHLLVSEYQVFSFLLSKVVYGGMWLLHVSAFSFLRSIFVLDAKWQQNRDPDEGGRSDGHRILHLALSGRNELT
jgi:hypothetical protein